MSARAIAIDLECQALRLWIRLLDCTSEEVGSQRVTDSRRLSRLVRTSRRAFNRYRRRAAASRQVSEFNSLSSKGRREEYALRRDSGAKALSN